MLHGPAFLPHQTQVSMKTPCGSGCGYGDRLWMPPIRFRESVNNSNQYRKIGALSAAMSVLPGARPTRASYATLQSQPPSLPRAPPFQPPRALAKDCRTSQCGGLGPLRAQRAQSPRGGLGGWRGRWASGAPCTRPCTNDDLLHRAAARTSPCGRPGPQRSPPRRCPHVATHRHPLALPYCPRPIPDVCACAA